MRIAVIGGGPAGLYFSILMKKADPFVDITVYERNLSDDTFGFGVVFSDQTLDNFERYDPESYAAITDEFAYWDDVEINFKGTRPPDRRQRLLRLRAPHASPHPPGARGGARREVRLPGRRRGHRAASPTTTSSSLADGINCRIPRSATASTSCPSVDLRPNKFAWMGSATPLDAFTFAFEETE